MPKQIPASDPRQDRTEPRGVPPVLVHLVLALLYFVLAKTGQLLAIPPGYVTIVWPAAGLAFAAGLRYGSARVWPGILMGSFLANSTVGVAFQFGFPAFGIAVGSTLQALLGTYLLRKTDPRFEISRARDSALFVAVTAVSCLVAPTIGNTTLWLSGKISSSQVPASFLSWWLGDAFGVAIFLPLVLAFIDPRSLWRRRRVQVGVPLLTSILLCSLIYQLASNQETSAALSSAAGPSLLTDFPASSFVLFMALVACAALVQFMLLLSAAAERVANAVLSQTARLTEITERLRLALDSAEMGIWDIDANTGQVDWDDRMFALFGVEREQFANAYAAWKRGIHPDDRVRVAGEVTRTLRQEQTFVTQYRVVWPNGEIREIRAHAIVRRDASGKPTRMAGLNYDVTVHQRAEAALQRAKEEAEKTSQVKSQFVANMSHEIRTPLNGVLGCARLLLATELSPEQRELLTTIQSSGRTLRETLDEILDFSKLESAPPELEGVALALGVLLRETLAIHRAEATSKGLAMELEVDPALPALVRGDATRLRQALSNLISNAVKFTERGSVHILVAPQGELVCFAVEDTGIGVAPHELERLFQPFSQADASTTRRFGGTGLGLWIVRRLALAMGGDSGYSARDGAGSRFWFTARLPAETNVPAQPEVSPPAPRRGRVLLAEDNPVNLLVETAYLSDLGQEVVTVTNGRAAVEACLAGEWDLVLMDCQMPVMDGYDATREIRRREQGRRTPISALTASTLPEDKERCFAAGMDDHLGKPVDPEQLAALLTRWLGPSGK